MPKFKIGDRVLLWGDVPGTITNVTIMDRILRTDRWTIKRDDDEGGGDDNGGWIACEDEMELIEPAPPPYVGFFN
jgi:hypothetical protein